MKRIESLDGLRGLAILLVLMFHAYARWPDLIPWTTQYRELFLFKYGFLGVQLFFLISGFVIYMTLENCASFKEFIARRWLRLFPAMLIATILIYSSAGAFAERPYGLPGRLDFIPGLFLLQENWINALFRVQIRPLEGAFWSLFVEVKFYMLFGLLYFLDKRRSISYLTGLFLAYFLLKVLFFLDPTSPLGASAGRLVSGMGELSIQHFGWFASGAWLYRYLQEGCRRALIVSAALLIPNTLITLGASNEHLPGWIVCLALYLSFVLALNAKSIQRFFSCPPLLFLGGISYPLYLLHENALVAMTIKSHAALPFLPKMLTPLPGVLLIVCVAWAVAEYFEPLLRRWIKNIVPLRGPRWTGRGYAGHR